MKKRLIILFILLNFILLYAEDKAVENKNLFFYIPTQENINDYFNLLNFLKQWEENKINIPDDKLLFYYNGYIGQNSLQGLLFEAFLRQTKNKEIQKQLLRVINKNKLNNIITTILIRLYNSKENKVTQNNNTQIQYNYNNKYFDENINLFKQSEILVFNEELGLMLFENSWAKFKINNKDTKNINENSFFLMYGGGTNSVLITFNRFNNISFKNFKKNEIDKNFNYEKYKDWKVQEIKKEGVLERSGADKIFIGLGVGPDNAIPEIDNGSFNIYLYNEKLQKGYSVSFFMNFSKINNNYDMRVRIWNHLLMQLIFVYIKI